jgi:hypothetical protein
MAAKKIKKAVAKKTIPKKAVAKKVAPKKKAKKAAPEEAAPATRAIIIPGKVGIPCICIKSKKRWFCMKKENGALIQCDGPFATKEECEAHVCIES